METSPAVRPAPRWAVITTGLALVAWMLVAPAANGHSAQLDSMDPPEGATITGMRSSATLTYSQPVRIVGLAITLPDGREVEPVTRTREDGAVMDYALPRSLEPGTAIIRWQVPQEDGHVIDYERTYEYAESKVDPRVGMVESQVAEIMSALRAALARLP